MDTVETEGRPKRVVRHEACLGELALRFGQESVLRLKHVDQSVGDPARDLEAGEKGFKCLMCRLAARDTATGLLVERGQERSIEEGAEKAYEQLKGKFEIFARDHAVDDDTGSQIAHDVHGCSAHIQQAIDPQYQGNTDGRHPDAFENGRQDDNADARRARRADGCARRHDNDEHYAGEANVHLKCLREE